MMQSFDPPHQEEQPGGAELRRAQESPGRHVGGVDGHVGHVEQAVAYDHFVDPRCLFSPNDDRRS